MGCTLLVTLIGNPDGRSFLAEDPFLGQIVDCFAQLDPVGPTTRLPVVEFSLRT